MDYRPGRVLSLMAATLIAVVANVACSGPPAVVPASAPHAQAQDAWRAYAAGFIEEYLKSQPFFAVRAGRHEYDGQMPDSSAAGIAAQIARLKTWRAAASAFEAAKLSPDERFEREYLLWVLDTDLYWLDRARSPFTNPKWYLDRLDPDVYLTRNYAPLATRLQGYLGYARAIPRIAADIRANLSTPLPATFIERGIAGFGGFADFYRHDVPRVFAAVGDPQAQKDLHDANENAARAMQSLKAWLESQRPQASGNFALGEPQFLEMLKATERVEVPMAGSSPWAVRTSSATPRRCEPRVLCTCRRPRCPRVCTRSRPTSSRAARSPAPGRSLMPCAISSSPGTSSPCRATSRRRWPKRRPTPAPTAPISASRAPTKKTSRTPIT